MEEQNKHGVINKFLTSNKATKIILIIVIIGGTLVVLANLEAPGSSSNLLSYCWHHSKSWQCKIKKQEYLDSNCLEQKNCSLNIGNGYPFEEYEKKEILSRPECNECRTKETNGTISLYKTYFGDYIRGYYLGIIPVLEQGCPKGYSPE